MAKEFLLNGSFFNRTIKESIHKTMYGLAKLAGVKGKMTIVSGPDIIKHIGYAREISNEEVNIVEIEEEVHQLQKEILKNTPASMSSDVTLIHKDLMEAEPTKFIDADLLASVINCGVVIEHVFEKQRIAFENQSKAFLFTVALRPVTTENTIKWINEHILNYMNVKITNYNNVIIESIAPTWKVDENGNKLLMTDKLGRVRPIMKTIMKYNSKLELTLEQITGTNENILEDIIIHQYRDEKCNMLTVSIIYK